MSDKPVNHGRDHRRGGTDPITPMEWCIAKHLFFSLANDTGYPTPTHVSVGFEDPGSGSYAFVASDPAKFAQAAAGGTTGIKLLEFGVYEIHLYVDFGAGGGGSGTYAEAYPAATAGTITSDFAWGADQIELVPADSKTRRIGTGFILSTGTSQPVVYATAWQNSGATLTPNFELYIKQIDTQAPDFSNV